MKQELGPEWSEFILFENLDVDMLGSAVVSILDWNQDKIEILNELQRRRLGLMAALNCANGAKELCEKLGIVVPNEVNEATRAERLKEYFGPLVDQSQLTI